MRVRQAAAALGASVALVGLASPTAFAAHESNNRAELTGSGITGVAIVNYAKGAPEEWRSHVNLRGLPDGTYTFRVAGGPVAGLVQPICTFIVDGNGGRQGCGDDTDLRGFSRAEVVDATGTVVASGVFARRGGQRVG